MNIIGLLLALAAPTAWGQTLEVYPTLHNLGYRVAPVPADVASATVEYRVAGEPEWRQGFTPTLCEANAYAENYNYEQQLWWPVEPDRGAIIRRANGSVFGVQAGTAYDVRVSLLRADGTASAVLTGSTTTWDEEHPFGVSTGAVLEVGAGKQYATLQQAYTKVQPGQTILVYPGVYTSTPGDPYSFTCKTAGLPGQPITLRGLPGAVIQCGYGDIMSVRSYWIVEGITFRTGCELWAGTMLNLWSSRGVVVQDCTFEVTRNLQGISHEGWVSAENASQIVIRRNTVTAVGHQYGMLFNISKCRGVVFEDNTATLGRAEIDFMCVRTCGDVDIADNQIIGWGTDDFWELEFGPNVNVRVINNQFTVTNALDYVSMAPVFTGPVYFIGNTIIIRNSLTKLVKYANNLLSPELTAGHVMVDFGRTYWLHNTISRDPAILATPQYLLHYLCHGNVVFTNNVFAGYNLDPQKVRDAATLPRTATDWGQIASDYNVWFDAKKFTSSGYGQDLHSVFTAPGLCDTNSSVVPWSRKRRMRSKLLCWK